MRYHLIFRMALGLAAGLAVAGCASSSASSEIAGATGTGGGTASDDGGSASSPADLQHDASPQPGPSLTPDVGPKLDGSVTPGSGQQPGTTPEPDAGVTPTSPKLDGSTVPSSSPDASMSPETMTPPPPPPPTMQIIDPKYVNLAIPLGTPLDPSKGDAHPLADYKPPAGWSWYNIEGAKCRDGSQNGIMVHWAATKSTKLLLYFEGGGACTNAGFCALNPVKVSQTFLSGGETVLTSLMLLDQAQAPSGDGIFALTNKDNPYKDWNMVYIPYCTGDVHFGAAPQGKIDGVTEPQMFVGAKNTQLIIARVAATFADTTRFIAAGSSAGGYGAGLNFGMIQDTFGAKAYGTAILDASPPFSNEFSPACVQKHWRENWNLDANLPSDCGAQCKSADGGNLFNIMDYWRAKYPSAKIALISGIHDEIIRLFFSLGNDNCANYGADPTALFIGTIGQTYDPDKFKAGLLDVRKRYAATNQLATYYMDGFPNATAHQCLFRPRVYQEAAGAGLGTIASFLGKFAAGTMTQVGP